MGIVNVTPDSFADGGKHLDPEAAAAAAREMIAQGAALVDVGGESTRPGAEGVSLDDELRRVLPVLERLDGVPFSIDTAKAEVARRALALGAELVNDVTALRGDPELAGVVAEAGGYVCLMHMQGEPRTMQSDPRYEDVVSEVAAFLEQRLAFAVSAGIPEERVCLDPGIGFGKTAGAELRADPAARRARRARAAGARGPLAQELARKAVRPRRAHGQPCSIARRRGRRVRARRLDLPRPRRPRARRGARRGAGGRVIVELHGLELHGRHGALDWEREQGQLFLFDVELEVGEAGSSDRLEDAVDYRDVVACVRDVSDGRAYNLLEALATALADELLARFPVERASVRVRKPQVVLDLPVEHAAVRATRP